MDETGLDVQVLSLTAPGVQSLEATDAAALQIASNDLLAETVRSNPEPKMLDAPSIIHCRLPQSHWKGFVRSTIKYVI